MLGKIERLVAGGAVQALGAAVDVPAVAKGSEGNLFLYKEAASSRKRNSLHITTALTALAQGLPRLAQRRKGYLPVQKR